ncbi:MAG: hypothetical protein Q9223_007664 [Gallowayella weberi]
MAGPGSSSKAVHKGKPSSQSNRPRSSQYKLTAPNRSTPDRQRHVEQSSRDELGTTGSGKRRRHIQVSSGGEEDEYEDEDQDQDQDQDLYATLPAPPKRPRVSSDALQPRSTNTMLPPKSKSKSQQRENVEKRAKDKAKSNTASQTISIPDNPASSPQHASASGPQLSSKSTTMSKTEEEAFTELDLLVRRYFPAFLSNTMVHEPIATVFPGMSKSHPTYKQALKRTRSNYKTWKGRILKTALEWINKFVKNNSFAGNNLEHCDDFKTVKSALIDDFQDHWLQQLFQFAREAVDWSEISEAGLIWLRYVFCMICTHARMTHLRKDDKINPHLAKYEREHFLDMFDGFVNKAEFKDNITLEDYPPISSVSAASRRPRPQLNLDDDSDADVGGQFQRPATPSNVGEE